MGVSIVNDLDEEVRTMALVGEPLVQEKRMKIKDLLELFLNDRSKLPKYIKFGDNVWELVLNDAELDDNYYYYWGAHIESDKPITFFDEASLNIAMLEEHVEVLDKEISLVYEESKNPYIEDKINIVESLEVIRDAINKIIVKIGGLD